MKRYLFFLMFAVFLLLPTTHVYATEFPNVAISNAIVKNGEIVDITIDLSNCEGFTNLSFEISYDDTAMTLVGATNGNVSATFTKSQNFSSNPYNVSWNSSEDVVFTGTLATLKFEVSGVVKSGSYPISIDYYKGRDGKNVDGYHVNYDENFDSLNMTYTNGVITVVSNETEEVVPSEVYVGVDKMIGKKGEYVTLPLTINNNKGFTNISVELTYDSEALTLIRAENKLSGSTMTTAEEYSKYPYNISWDVTDNIEYNGTLAILIFKVSENAEYGSYPVAIDYYKGRNGMNIDGYHVNYDENFEALNLSYVDGLISVKPTKHEMCVKCEISGKNIALNVDAFSPDSTKGNVIFALYDGNKMLDLRILDAGLNLNTSFEKKGTRIKIMWIDLAEGLTPLCNYYEFFINENT